jgi:hypothetical protein
MTTGGIGVGDGEGDGEGLGDAGAVDGRTCMPAWAVPHAVRAKARTGAIIRIPGPRLIARGFYEFRRRRINPGRTNVIRSVSYPWTRVPKDAPPLDAWQLRLLPLADLFMGLMWSRPGGLSLRTTWVTPATLGLAVAVIFVVGLPGLAAIAFGIATRQLLFVFGGLVATALGVGAAAVALYGIRQRRLP